MSKLNVYSKLNLFYFLFIRKIKWKKKPSPKGFRTKVQIEIGHMPIEAVFLGLTAEVHVERRCQLVNNIMVLYVYS